MARGRLWFHDGSSASACRRRRPNMKEQRAKEKLQQQRVVDREWSALVDSLIKDSTGGGGWAKQRCTNPRQLRDLSMMVAVFERRRRWQRLDLPAASREAACRRDGSRPPSGCDDGTGSRYRAAGQWHTSEVGELQCCSTVLRKQQHGMAGAVVWWLNKEERKRGAAAIREIV